MQDGDTALIKAIVSGNSAMTELLIECGANKDHQNKVNRTRVSGILFGCFIPCMIMSSVFCFRRAHSGCRYASVSGSGQIKGDSCGCLSELGPGSILCVSQGKHTQNN